MAGIMVAMTNSDNAATSTGRRATRPGWSGADAAFWQALLDLPELAIVAESCPGERRLHARLGALPTGAIDGAELAAIANADSRANFAHFLAFRDALCEAGTLEAYYLGLMRGGSISVPPVFIDAVVAAIVERLLAGSADAFERRAGQMLYRQQRIALSDGRLLAADRDVADRLSGDAPVVDLVRGVVHNGAAVAAMSVLGTDTIRAFFAAADPHAFVLDLTHETRNDLGHGLAFTLTRAQSGQAALARVLERWIAHFLDVETKIVPLQRIDDPAWAWHIGLDVDASAFLDALYRGHALEPDRLQRLIGLFRLEFADPRRMRADLAGKPVYLGLAMNVGQMVKLKPQNLLLNLPLAAVAEGALP